MARKLKTDHVLFSATIVLVALSLVMVYSASAPVALSRYGQASFFLTKQVMWAALGLPVLWLLMRVDYRTYREPVFIWTCLSLVTLALVGVLFSPPINSARRWFGVAGIGIQPSEFAKLVTIFFTAAILERRLNRIDDVAYSLTPIAVVVALLVGLILLEPDFGTAMSVLVIAVAMIYVAGLHSRYIVAACLAALPAVYIVAMGAPYRRRRLLTFLNPWEDPLGDGFQIIQSLIAVGTGGISGRGLMNGVQKLFYLPEPHTDFIYSVIAEEMGLIGATAVLACFIVITWRGLRAAINAPDSFGALLATGLTAMVGVQALVNISVTLGLLPTKGMPLPLVSAGGSSLLVCLVGIGILLNVSQHATPDV